MSAEGARNGGATPDPGSVLRIRDLEVAFHTEDGVVRAVEGISLDIRPGRTLGVVGESGSGKSVTAMSILRLLPPETARIGRGGIALLDRDVLALGPSALRKLRGGDAAMIFQEPMTSLNPMHTVGAQVMEAITTHERVSSAEARRRTVALFREVDLPDPESRIDSYPHEMSGGQKQRVMIAMALACHPKLLIADEPTTALDVTIQKQILDLLRRLRDARDMSILFITHDLGVIAELADEVAVMFKGHLVEYGRTLDIFERPQHPYTRALLACRPRLDTTARRLPTTATFMDWSVDDEGRLEVVEKPPPPAEGTEGVVAAPTSSPPPPDDGPPLLKVDGLSVHFPIRRGFWSRTQGYVRAVDGVSFEVRRGQTLGLVGESGCGKTTTGRALLRLIDTRDGVAIRGRVTFDGIDLTAAKGRALRALRRRLQIVFQDPYASLNPRMSVGATLMEPMIVHGLAKSAAQRRERAVALLEEVGLEARHLRRYPHEFSGGQRQRISIARALAVEPEFIVCDDSVSALDVSVQAQVLNLLKDLQAQRGLTYVFISHDLSVVKFMSDTMAVMRAGRIVESGPSEAIYADPEQDYTRRLIAAVPDDDIEALRARQAQRAASS
ncbi:MAG: dipeptide ABC transporter ATP-binding protein [Myxococcota bacterium]